MRELLRASATKASAGEAPGRNEARRSDLPTLRPSATALKDPSPGACCKEQTPSSPREAGGTPTGLRCWVGQSCKKTTGTSMAVSLRPPSLLPLPPPPCEDSSCSMAACSASSLAFEPRRLLFKRWHRGQAWQGHCSAGREGGGRQVEPRRHSKRHTTRLHRLMCPQVRALQAQAEPVAAGSLSGNLMPPDAAATAFCCFAHARHRRGQAQLCASLTSGGPYCSVHACNAMHACTAGWSEGTKGLAYLQLLQFHRHCGAKWFSQAAALAGPSLDPGGALFRLELSSDLIKRAMPFLAHPREPARTSDTTTSRWTAPAHKYGGYVCTSRRRCALSARRRRRFGHVLTHPGSLRCGVVIWVDRVDRGMDLWCSSCQDSDQ